MNLPPPTTTVQVLAQIVRTAGLPTAATLRMEDDLTNFGDSLGGCERLLRTPIPLFYTRHTSRFLMIWLTFLPATLWPACGLLTLPLVFLISFLLLGEQTSKGGRRAGDGVELHWSGLENAGSGARLSGGRCPHLPAHPCTSTPPCLPPPRRGQDRREHRGTLLHSGSGGHRRHCAGQRSRARGDA